MDETTSIDGVSDPVPYNDICVDVPDNEDVAFKAVRSNDTTTIQQCLFEGYNINTRHIEDPADKEFMVKDWTRIVRQFRLKQYTMLHVAVIHGTAETVKLLLSQGSGVNMVDENGMSPLSVASAIQRPDIVELLIKHGANVDIQSVSGRTPLIQAIQAGSLPIIKQLIQAGANLDLADKKGTTPLVTCLTASKVTRMDIMQALIKGGCEVNISNKQGATPLMTAVGLGKNNAILTLLEAGAHIDDMDKAGKNAFHMAVGVKTAQLLINHGASSDTADKNGIRPLDRAAKNGHVGMMRLLLLSDCQRSTSIMDLPRVVQVRQSLPFFDHWLHEELYNPRDLRRLCREIIRRSLSPANTARISELPIPGPLKDFLLVKHLDVTFSNIPTEAITSLSPPVVGLGLLPK